MDRRIAAVSREENPQSQHRSRAQCFATLTYMIFLWIVIALVLLVAEYHTQAFIAAFVAMGVLAAAICALVGLPLFIQVIAAVAVGGGSLAFLRRWAMNHVRRRSGPPLKLTGTQAMVGKEGLVIEAVGDESHPGHVRLGGERWLAISATGDPVPVDDKVLILDVRGTMLVVAPSNDPE